MKGSACGRCMKMCPWNREDAVEARKWTMLSIHTPSARKSIIAMDDKVGNGKRNPVKKWWFDLEVIDGIAVVPPGGTNERDLNLNRGDVLAPSQKLAMFPPPLQPPGVTTLSDVVPVDRIAGLNAYAEAEDQREARSPLTHQGIMQTHYGETTN